MGMLYEYSPEEQAVINGTLTYKYNILDMDDCYVTDVRAESAEAAVRSAASYLDYPAKSLHAVRVKDSGSDGALD
jgi:hypothetical protein